MAVVKGQPNLLGTLETIVKATEKRRRRAEKGGASSSTQQTNLNMVFYGPPGTGKTFLPLEELVLLRWYYHLLERELVAMENDFGSRLVDVELLAAFMLGS